MDDIATIMEKIENETMAALGYISINEKHSAIDHLNNILKLLDEI